MDGLHLKRILCLLTIVLIASACGQGFKSEPLMTGQPFPAANNPGNGGLPKVPESDYTLDPVSTFGRPVVGTITGYEMDSGCPWAQEKCEVPLFQPYNRNNPEWWDNLVEELLFSRVHVVMAHGRGCFDANSGDDGNGNMCPRLLRHLVAAIDRAGARNVIRLGMFDDTGAYQGAKNNVRGLPENTRFDLADFNEAVEFFWNRNMRIWFDQIPRDLWYMHNGRPVVAFWTLSSYFFVNQRNNASRLLRELKSRFLARYGVEPLFQLDDTWGVEDPSITINEAYGMNSWFDPVRANYTYFNWNNRTFGVIVPSFRDPNNYPGCGAACRELTRGSGGSRLTQAFNAGLGAEFILLEGHTNIAESAGFYRSKQWEIPSLYLNLIRERTDKETKSLRFQAEAADRFQDKTPVNHGGQYRDDAIDIAKLSSGSGWYVGWTEPGEWIEFAQSYWSSGTYKITVRVATPSAGKKMSLLINGQTKQTLTLPSTGGYDNFAPIPFEPITLNAGKHDIRLVFETGDTNVDWLFFKRQP